MMQIHPRNILLGIAAAVSIALPAPARDCDIFRVLVFSKTTGFRHDAQIQVGIELIRRMGMARDFAVDASEDSTVFSTQNLEQYAVVIFLNTTGDILDANQEAAFETYIASGGGFVGVHAATDTEYSWPFYGDLIGTWFESHPAIQDGSLRVVDDSHAATAPLPSNFIHRDEWYNFQSNPADDPDIQVLLEIDESSYIGGTMGDPHPIAWYRQLPGGARSFYTALGHTLETYAAPFFQRHLLGGILFAAGSTRAGQICQFDTRGTSSGSPALGLSANFDSPGLVTLELQGGASARAGLLLLGSCPDDQGFGPYRILLDLDPRRLQLVLPLVFDASGSFTMQLPRDVLLPASQGTSIFMQAAQIEAGLGLSNGLELRICR